MYNIGGWMIKPGSCNKGFRSRPSAAAGSKRSKGLDKAKMNSKKPTDTQPSTPTTRATMAWGRLKENAATAAVHKASISTHNSNEPS